MWMRTHISCQVGVPLQFQVTKCPPTWKALHVIHSSSRTQCNPCTGNHCLVYSCAATYHMRGWEWQCQLESTFRLEHACCISHTFNVATSHTRLQNPSGQALSITSNHLQITHGKQCTDTPLDDHTLLLTSVHKVDTVEGGCTHSKRATSRVF